MDYEYKVFISYKRYCEWTPWVCETFVPLLKFHLSNALGDDATICIDREIEVGRDWPNDLGKKLTTSSVLVPLFSKMYFGSTWCLRELYAFRFKEVHFGLRTTAKPEGIIVPARIHDGTEEDLPEHLHDCCRIQAIDLTEYALTSLKRSSRKYVKFEETVRSWAEQSIRPAVERALQLRPLDSWLEEISEHKFPCPAPANYKLRYPTMARPNDD